MLLNWQVLKQEIQDMAYWRIGLSWQLGPPQKNSASLTRRGPTLESHTLRLRVLVYMGYLVYMGDLLFSLVLI